MDSLTASNISEILNNNIKELSKQNKNIYTLLVENIYLVSTIIVVLLLVVGYYFYQNIYKNNQHIQEKLEVSNKQLLEQQKLNNDLSQKNNEYNLMLQKQQEELNKRVVEGIDSEDGLNVVNHEEEHIEEPQEEYIEEPEIEINTDDIIKNIEYLEDTDSENLEDQNIRNLNLSVQEMENINNKLFR